MSGVQDWAAAYRNAEYRVLLLAGDLVLGVGVHRTENDARLRQECGVQAHWAILTPCNPGSQLLGAEANQQRLAELKSILHTCGESHIETVNRDPAGRWPDEPGVLLCDPLPGLAEELGRRFAQNAILCGQLGAAPELVWLS